MHLQANILQVHKFEDGFTAHTIAFLILCERWIFKLISDLSGVLFAVTMLRIIDGIRLQKNWENLEVMLFIILYLDWYYNDIVTYLACL